MAEARVARCLVARWIRVISAPWSGIISSGSSSPDSSSPDAYRHSTAHGCAAVNATTINATVMDANATHANPSSIGKGVGRDSRNKHDADDSGGSKRNNGSTRHD
jgi:hypothetical protein